MIRRVRWTWLTILSSIIAISASGAPPTSTPQKNQFYVLIVANNHSLDKETAPLRFADDDGAKYYEMFQAAGANTALLTVLDADAKERYPEAAKVAVAPYREALMTQVELFFEQMTAARQSGATTHFVFIYSGHGNMGANREAYFNLIDSKFERKALYHELLAKSPATYNHLILDACHAYYMVNKKGESDKTGDYSGVVRSFLNSEELKNYPNTGVILASSVESETHEWGQWESGIFSHELRSALLGAGDVNGDGKITYKEAATCVEAANAGIKVPRARLKVYYRPPAINEDLPLIDINNYPRNRRIYFPKEMAGKFHIEDARGVRIADFNYSEEQGVTLHLTGEAPFFVRTETSESIIEDPWNEVLASNLQFTDRASTSKGSVERSFRKDLYTIPFGMGFFRGAMAILNPAEIEPPPQTVVSDSIQPSRPLSTLGWVALGGGVAAGIGSALTYSLANKSYEQYKTDEQESDARVSQRDAENRLLTSRILLGVGSALALTGATLLITDLMRRSKRRPHRVSGPLMMATDNQVCVGMNGHF